MTVLVAAPFSQLIDGRLPFQLHKVALLELRPPLGFVAEPSAQVCRRSDIFHPFVQFGLLLRAAPRPDAIDENAVAIVSFRVVIDAFDPHRHSLVSLAYRAAEV